MIDNQLAKPETFQRITLVVIAVLLIFLIGAMSGHLLRMSDPYVKNVLALTGDSVRGHAIFQINCSGCHGLQADGSIGPSLQSVGRRKSKLDLIDQVITGKTPPMPKFQPDPQEMADLLGYLETL